MKQKTTKNVERDKESVELARTGKTMQEGHTPCLNYGLFDLEFFDVQGFAFLRALVRPSPNTR